MRIFKLAESRFTDLQNRIKAYLSKTLSDYGESYGTNTIFGQLVNVLGSVVQNMLMYVEDGMTEQNKLTAQRKKSIYSLAELGGYTPSLGKAASCNLQLCFQPNNYGSTSVIVPNKTKLVCSYNGLVYNIVLPQEAITLSVENDNANKFLQAVEGTYETQEFFSQGGQLYTQNVMLNGDIDTDYLEVRVNDELWAQCASVYDMEPEGKQYVVKSSMDKGIDLVFGNGQFGMQLATGDKITVTYLLHDGELGNIDIDETVYFSFQDLLHDTAGQDVDGNELFVVTLAANDPVNSGTYSETAAQVKEMIGYNSRALVLADAKNYNVFLNRFSFVGYNRTWSDAGSLVVNSIVLKNYKNAMSRGGDYFSLKEEDLFLSSKQKESVIQCIASSGQQLAGVTYKINDPEVCKYCMYVYLKMKDTPFDRVSVETGIRDAVGRFMADIDSDIFIPKSDMAKVIKDTSEAIDGIDIYFISERNEDAITNGWYVNKTYRFNPAKGTYDITTETVRVEPGTNPMLGLDEHGNIYLDNNDQFPVLMGGWRFRNNGSEITVTDPLKIVFRN